MQRARALSWAHRLRNQNSTLPSPPSSSSIFQASSKNVSPRYLSTATFSSRKGLLAPCSPFYMSARFLSIISKEKPVKILYASQGGTAQIFAVQLEEALEERSITASVQGLHEDSPTNLLEPGKAFHVFLAATAGVGEPPDNARKFTEWLTEQVDAANGKQLEGLDFCVFGLGNQKAHPNHYNFFGKRLDQNLAALGATRVYDLGLGDDGDCLEDDYDTWMEEMLQHVYGKGGEGEDKDEEEEEKVAATETAAPTATVEDPNVTSEPCMGARVKGGNRLISKKYDRLTLFPPKTDVCRTHLFHLEEPFYIKNTNMIPVLSNRPLNSHAGENGMYEMRLSLENTENVTYETGDHLMVYPQNSEVMVQGYLQQMDVNPHVIIDVADEETSRYPHPTGISLTETLTHCVDLSAVPSPNVARLLTGRKQIDYKNEIATPRRTVLDLLANAPRKFALEEILYNLPPMKPRYYSIASSNLVHPKEIFLVYRPVNYTTTQGHLRTGVSTSYLKNMMSVQDTTLDAYNTDSIVSSSHVIASVNSNPSFRLPSDPKTPVLFIAGGCGIAPIRAFLEERMHTQTKSEAYLFLGFRSPWDTPYKAMVDKAFQCGAISNLQITFSAQCNDGLASMPQSIQPHTSCGLVSDAVGEHGEQLYSFFERGGHTYICGGARLFGVAIENEVHKLLETYGNLSEEEATNYLRKLSDEARFHEDLSD